LPPDVGGIFLRRIRSGDAIEVAAVKQLEKKVAEDFKVSLSGHQFVGHFIGKHGGFSCRFDHVLSIKAVDFNGI